MSGGDLGRSLALLPRHRCPSPEPGRLGVVYRLGPRGPLPSNAQPARVCEVTQISRAARALHRFGWAADQSKRGVDNWEVL